MMRDLDPPLAFAGGATGPVLEQVPTVDGVPLSEFYDFEAARMRLPSGKDGRPPHISKVYKLARVGDNGVLLRALKWPGRMVTCDRWIAQFLEAVDRARRAASAGDR